MGILYLLFIGPVRSGNAQHLLPETSHKYKVTRQVFDRLTHVFANSRPQPQLEMIAGKSHSPAIIAQYKPGNRPLIQLSEEVYDLCRKLGKDSLNALAVLLSHELAHHYEKHDWYYTFGIGRADIQASKEDIQRFESEADFYGCFYGELAGFSTGRIFPLLLDMVYQRFGLAEQLHGYPSKEERKAIYSKKQMEAVQMFSVFKAGQFLYLIQEFEQAASCFYYLLNRFPSREILNNLSAAKLQQALILYNAYEPPGFIYPVELDARSRLTAIHRGSPTQFKSKLFQQLLSEARKYSEKSREIDPSYIPAYINLACVYSLAGNQAAAIGVINELEPNKMSGNAYTIRGIAYYKDKQIEKAKKDFEIARQKEGYMAAYNLELYNKLNESMLRNMTVWIRSWFTQNEASFPTHTPKQSEVEKIGGEVAYTSLPSEMNSIKVSEKPYLLIQWRADQTKLLLNVQATNSRYIVRFTYGNYTGKTGKGLNQGSKVTALSKQYGTPTYIFPASSGEYWVYKDQKLAFEINQNGQITNWLIYALSL